MTRVIDFEGIRNFRHFGDYDARDGAKVRSGLFRSGHFYNATETDQQKLKDLNISVVADLRRPRERDNEPSNWGEGLRVLQSDVAGHKEPPHLRFIREGDVSIDGVSDFMRATYRRLPNEAGWRSKSACSAKETFIYSISVEENKKCNIPEKRGDLEETTLDLALLSGQTGMWCIGNPN